jgi:hypothetical protein
MARRRICWRLDRSKPPQAVAIQVSQLDLEDRDQHV